jgi:hypothetical protein
MPANPAWFSKIDEAIGQLQQLPSAWVDRSMMELFLGVGRRRAQQILQPFIRRTLGANGLANRDEVIRYLRGVSTGQSATFEIERRSKFAQVLVKLHRERKENPRVLVEAPTNIVNQTLEGLPDGVVLSPGRIVLEGFQTPDEAKQKLLALIMAMGNDPVGFDERITSCPTK